MKTHAVIVLALVLAALTPVHQALADEKEHPASTRIERTTADGHSFEDSVVVKGTVRELKALLYQLHRWPEIFSDVGAVAAHEAGRPWSVDFRKFGHPHDFDVIRAPRGVVLELADRSHGRARLEYLLHPVDATRSRLTVRLSMTTPPQLGKAEAAALLRAKAASDLQDFSTISPGNR